LVKNNQPEKTTLVVLIVIDTTLIIKDLYKFGLIYQKKKSSKKVFYG